MPALSDEAARHAIRTELDASFVVEAAAGTGKTTELVRRITAVIAAGAARVDQIAAVTFTEKAAGELKLRLRAGLEAGRHEERDPDRRKSLERALAHLEEARVGTIHSFCAELLRERPVEAGLDPAFGTLTEDEARRLHREVFDRWFEEQQGAPPEGLRRSIRRTARGSTAPERLRSASWDLIEWRDFPAAWAWPAWDRSRAIADTAAQVVAFARRTEGPRRPGDAFFEDTAPARELAARLREARDRRTWDDDDVEAALVALAADSDFARARKGGSSKEYADGIPRAAVHAEHAAILALLADFAKMADADLAAKLQDELAEVGRRYDEVKARSGLLDFVDLLVRARGLVRDRTDVRAALQARVTRIFVDEFQDTDPLQAEILLLLAGSDPEVRRWRDATPAPGRLFVVGDPKQAIYRFRRADLAIYTEVKGLMVRSGATVALLSTSFRAVPSLQRLVNACFAPLMTGERAQAGYVPLAPLREDVETQPAIVALGVPRPYGATRPTLAAIEASLPGAVGAFVAWLIAESGWTVTERSSAGAAPERVPIAARHVCLLFRRLTGFPRTDVTRAYVDALEARGVPHVLVGGRSFHQREEIEALTAALTAIEWPDDELSVFAALRGPLFGLADEPLLLWRKRHGRFDPRRIPDNALPDVADVAAALRVLAGIHRGKNHRPVADTVSLLLEATRAHAGLVLRPSGEQALANVLFLADLGRAWDASGGLSFRGFVERLAEEAESGAAREAGILEEGSDGVRLMTVHKAKGLEFPVVILADITGKLTGPVASRHVDGERELAALRVAGLSPLDLLEHEDDELEADRAEGVRLAYVAATRARDLLVVPAVGDAPAFPERSWVGPLFPGIYPDATRRRRPGRPPGCPAFGTDSVLERPNGQFEDNHTVAPGAHRFGRGEEGYDVVWWDPNKLDLFREPLVGVPRLELLTKDAPEAIVQADLEAYRAWSAERAARVESAGRKSLVVKTATEWAHGGVGKTPHVEIHDVPRDAGRPAGRRFGTLVHAVLATVPLDAEDAGGLVPAIAAAEGKVLGATADEIAAAASAASAALAHPLLARARAAAARGECRRETPLTLVLETGELVEGIVDLAFREEGRWTVVDFKTDREIEAELGAYQRQLGIYAEAIALATGDPATGALLRV